MDEWTVSRHVIRFIEPGFFLPVLFSSYEGKHREIEWKHGDYHI